MKRCILFLSFMAVFFLDISLNNSVGNAKDVLVVRWMDNARPDNLFEKYLSEMVPGVKFQTVSAKRDRNKLVKILQKYDFSKIDLVYSFGTTGTKIVKGYLKGKKPHVFNAVSAPVLSKIATSLEKPGNNLTGAKMLIDIDKQMDVLTRLKKIKSLAVWFDPREKQAQVVLMKMKEVAKEKGIKIYPFRIIPDAKSFDRLLVEASEKTNKLDALYFIASASFHQYYKRLHSKLSPSLLAMGALSYFVENGSTLALSPDEDNLSYVVAERAKRILNGEKAGTIPISVIELSNALMYINKEKAQKSGIGDYSKLGIKVVEVKSK